MSKFKVGDKVKLKDNNFRSYYIVEVVNFRALNDDGYNSYEIKHHSSSIKYVVIMDDDLELYKTPHERLLELGWVALNEANGDLTYLLNADGSLHPERIELSLEGKRYYTTLRLIDLELAEVLVDYLKELENEV